MDYKKTAKELKMLSISQINKIDAEIAPTSNQLAIWNLMFKPFEPEKYANDPFFKAGGDGCHIKKGDRLNRNEMAAYLNISPSLVTVESKKLIDRILKSGAMEEIWKAEGKI